MADDLDDDQTDEILDPPDDEDSLDEEVLDDDDASVDEFPDEEFPDEDETEDDADEPPPVKRGKAKAAEPAGDDEEGGDDDEDEPDPDDVEADLDTILKDRLVVADDDEEEEEDEVPEADDKVEGTKVRPRAPGEFVCQSCFLVKHPSQLAEGEVALCRDCV
ncbi:MAG: DUF4193 family protein [Actinomycetota bacterium]|nr:DUF4193 family protein [Actinomycetota bacterium]